jgi:hypothetical protein
VNERPTLTDRELVSLHEAAHAVAGHLWGVITGPVSIRRTRQWRGVAYVRPRRAANVDVERVDVALPHQLWPARVRRKYETEALIYLAGPAAERYLGDDLTVIAQLRAGQPAPASTPRTTQATSCRLPAAEARMLATGDQPGPRMTRDLEVVYDRAELLCGDVGEAEHLVSYWWRQMQNVVRSRIFRKPTLVLARTLLEEDTIPRRRVRRIITEGAP